MARVYTMLITKGVYEALENKHIITRINIKCVSVLKSLIATHYTNLLKCWQLTITLNFTFPEVAEREKCYDVPFL